MSLTADLRLSGRNLDLQFEVAAGETLALLGPNGAGKSTLLALLAGLLVPDDGSVCVADRTLVDVRQGKVVTWHPPHARRVGLLAQQALLFPHLSVSANVAFGPRSNGAGRRASAAPASRWLEAVGMVEYADRQATALSGGQAQRVALARALAAEPEVLLLDEPLAALDVEVTPAMRHLLRDVLADQTAIIATHDVLDALLLADRVAVIDGGRIVEQGPSAEVLARPRSAFAARIAGLNLVAGTWREGVLHTAGAAVHAQASEPVADGEHAVAVFRPSAVAVFLERPVGSPRNVFEAIIETIEPHGDLIRIRTTGAIGTLHADLTAASVAELRLAPGVPVWLSVKATELVLYRR